MLPHNGLSQLTNQPANGGNVVPRPSALQTIGGALNQAFGRCGLMPDELGDLLRKLDRQQGQSLGE